MKYSDETPLVDVCDRTSQVTSAIITATGNSNCVDVTETDLASITGLDLRTLNIIHRCATQGGIASLSEGDFGGLSNLQSLDLSCNHLSTLPPKIFSGLSSLQELSLDENELTTLPSGVFSGLSNLRLLSLSDNKLTTLPSDGFSGLSTLQELSLGVNELTALPSDIFNGLSELRFLYLDSNGLGSAYCNSLRARLSLRTFRCD